MKSFYLCLSVFICGFISGCAAPERVGYFGPTETLAEVIAGVNANNEQIPTLWGSGNFEVTLVDGGHSNYVNGHVILLYGRPGRLLMVGKKEFVDRVFEIGCNDSEYWMIQYGSPGRMLWGHHDVPARPDMDLPVSPQALTEVLGVQPLPTDLLREPAPVLRFNNDYDAYMIVWNQLLTDRWIAHKEIWYDRRTKLPMSVLLFDENGRVVVRAYLSGHKPVEISGAPRESWPQVATHYSLKFPDSGSKMMIDLGEGLKLTNSNVPNDRSFAFPTDGRGVENIQLLDSETPSRQAPTTKPQ